MLPTAEVHGPIYDSNKFIRSQINFTYQLIVNGYFNVPISYIDFINYDKILKSIEKSLISIFNIIYSMCYIFLFQYQ